MKILESCFFVPYLVSMCDIKSYRYYVVGMTIALSTIYGR
ncbi:hypothetical protein HMPREF3032_01535 [Veillonella sp. DNF00869]|nr:hypothetical protein HMPREF3032_01535 [Veillonella sp. DNF00869]